MDLAVPKKDWVEACREIVEVPITFSSKAFYDRKRAEGRLTAPP